MEMRTRARVAGYVDCILTGLSLVGAIALFIFIAWPFGHSWWERNWPILVICIILFVLQTVCMIPSILLIKSTSNRTDSKFACKWTHLWLYVQIFLIVLTFLSIPINFYLTNPNWAATGIQFAYRICLISVVYEFSGYLEDQIPYVNSNPGTLSPKTNDHV